MEMYYRRNAFIHCGGLALKAFTDNSRNGNIHSGEKLSCDFKYLESCFKKIHNYFCFIGDYIFKKLQLPKRYDHYDYI